MDTITPASSSDETFPSQTQDPKVPVESYPSWWNAQTETATMARETATQEAFDVSLAKDTIIRYYDLLSKKKYDEAYSLLSPSMPHLKPLDKWSAETELFIDSIYLIDVQHQPDFQATVAAIHEETSFQHPIYESDWCKVFFVTVDVDYVGGWGAEPSGIDSSFVVVKKEEDGWRLFSITSGIGRDACQ